MRVALQFVGCFCLGGGAVAMVIHAPWATAELLVSAVALFLYAHWPRHVA